MFVQKTAHESYVQGKGGRGWGGGNPPLEIFKNFFTL